MILFVACVPHDVEPSHSIDYPLIGPLAMPLISGHNLFPMPSVVDDALIDFSFFVLFI